MSLSTANNSLPTSARRAQAGSFERPTFRQRLEYVAASSLLAILGWLPHRLARGLCGLLAALCYWLWPRLRRVGLFNLRMVFPEWSERERRRVLFGLFQNFGRMLADFAQFPHLNRENIERLIIYDGFENYARAQSQGKGVLFLTAHFGNWELSSFAHGVYGHPCNFVVRELDNPLIGALVHLGVAQPLLAAFDRQSIRGNLNLVVSGGANTMTIKRVMQGKWLGSDCGSVKPEGE